MRPSLLLTARLSRARFLRIGFGALLLPACGDAGGQDAPRARADLYDCENCFVAQERDPAALLASVRLAGPDEPGERLILRARVLTHDNGRPAADVVIYAHHTNSEGLYANGSNENIWARRHGRLRGWARTGADGAYEFQTIKPAPYPDMSLPAHIHLYVLEPGRRPYWIDDAVFAGEFRVDHTYRRRMENRGGSGIVALTRQDNVWLAQRDIRLEPHPA